MNTHSSQSVVLQSVGLTMPPGFDEALACSRGQNPSIRFPLATSGWLLGLNGAHLGEDMRLYPGSNSIGSSARCSIVVTAPETGRHHAMIDVLSGESALIKPGSTQRDLFVNGVQCRSTLPLCHGDIIQIGEQYFAYIALLPAFSDERKTIQFRERLTSKYLCTIGWLVELTGDKEGRDYRLFPGENRVGSKPGLEVVLLDPEVKDRHAVITRHQENWTIVPVSVTEPFQVNGVPSTGTVLQNGDVLRLGQREFMFRTCRLAFTK